jgi:hypothetical protein
MKKDRREFLKTAGILGIGISGAGAAGCTGRAGNPEPFPQTHRQIFNMSGYAAPGLDVVRVAVIGLGNRGTGSVRRLASIEGVEIRAICDIEPDRVKRSAELIRPLGHNPEGYSGDENNWKKICERPDIDLVAVVTPWHLHTPMCVYAMENGKHAYTELPAATTMEECWQLVETSEKTRKHCVQMSGNCSGGINAVILNMIREGFFGEIVHAEGCYIHDLIPRHMFVRDFYHNNWRVNENIGRNGNLYPQHGLVPIIQMLDINCGDRMDYLTSVSSNDFSMNEAAKERAADDDFWKDYVDRDFRGSMNVTTIRTVKGRTIIMQHDVSTRRPRGGRLISGTKCIYQSSPDRLATDHTNWLSEEEFNSVIEKYTPRINKKFDELRTQAEQIVRQGHGYYMVTPVDWRLIDCLRNGLPVDMNVYDAAVSSAITPLSVWSTENRSNSVTVPDFTNGAWKTNQRVLDIQLERGVGSTRLV